MSIVLRGDKFDLAERAISNLEAYSSQIVALRKIKWKDSTLQRFADALRVHNPFSICYHIIYIYKYIL